MKHSKPPEKFRTTLIDTDDGSGDAFLVLPDAMVDTLGWKIGDSLEVDTLSDGTIVLSQDSEPESNDYEEVKAVAIETFGDRQMAIDWLHRENPSLGMSPVAYLNQISNKGEILKILQSIAHGGVV